MWQLLGDRIESDHNFNCSAIISNLLKIGDLPTAIDLHEDNVDLITKAIIDVNI